MKMVILTLTEAWAILKVLEDEDAYFYGERSEAIEILEEAIKQPQEYDIDSNNNPVPS